MQVGTERQAGSELHAWRQFLARSTLWLGVLLLGSAAICWVAANWQDMSKVQRFAGAQTLLAVCALAAAWAGLRLRTAAGARGAIPGALLALAGILLGALLALLGQTYQTGADTWELFAWWAVLLLPWALAAASQAVWLLWTLVVNVAMVLWLGERVFSWWGLLGATYLPALIVAGLNLAMLAGWELAARRWRASTLVGPRLLAALAIGALVMSTMYTDLFIGRSYGSTTGSIAWLVVTLVLGFYYQKVRRDLVILAMLAAGVICVSLRVVGNGCCGSSPAPGRRCPWPRCSWPRRSGPRAAARAGRRGQDGRAGGRCRARQRLGRQSRGPGPGRRAGGPGHSARDARRRCALVRAMPAGPERLAGDTAAAAVHRLVPDRQHAGRRAGRRAGAVRGRRGRAAQRGRSVLAAVRHGDGLCRRAAGHFRNIRLSFTNACLAVYVLGTDLILRFLSGLLIAGAAAGLIWRGLSPALVDENLFDALWRFDSARAAFLWLPIAVTGAWGAAVAFSLSRRDASPRARAAPLAWAFLLSVQCMVWLAGGISAQQLPAMWAVNPRSAVLVVAGALLPAAAALSVLAAPPRADGRPAVGRAAGPADPGAVLAAQPRRGLRAGLAAAGLRPGPAQPDRVRRGQPAGLPGRLLLPAGSAAAAKAVWLGGGALLLSSCASWCGWCRA